MRVFIAVDLSAEVLEKIGLLQKKLKSQCPQKGGATWVRPELMHVTLKFIADLDEAKLPDLMSIVSGIAAETHGFGVTVETVGTFGRPVRILWVGLRDEQERLAEIAGRLETDLEALGVEKEGRPFVGHLTLCRIKDYKFGREISRLVEHLGVSKFGSFNVNALSIYKSQLTPTGPVYTLLGKFELNS